LTGKCEDVFSRLERPQSLFPKRKVKFYMRLGATRLYVSSTFCGIAF
jgi:hypothetical protein